MQVIQRNRAYNTEADIKKAPLRAALARQNAADLKSSIKNISVVKKKKIFNRYKCTIEIHS